MRPLLLAAALATTAAPGVPATPAVGGGGADAPASAPPAGGEEWVEYLETISKWVMQRHLPTDNLTHCPDWPPGELQTSIFINGNLARILLATAQLTSNASYADEAMLWCDKLCDEQAQTTCHGAGASDATTTCGYWGVGYGGIGPGPLGSVYFGDTGTAVTTLAMCTRLAKPSSPRAKRYRTIMSQYETFVRNGPVDEIRGRGAAPPSGWVIPSGPDRGAVGCGYYEKHLSTKPYVIATATTGGAFFAEFAQVQGGAAGEELKRTAAEAMAYITRVVMPSGEIPCARNSLENC